MTTTTISTRAEHAARVQELSVHGLVAREIGERLGLSRSYVAELLADPDGSNVAARKAKAKGTCVDCGKTTAYDTGGPARRCDPCARSERSRRAALENPCGTRAAYARGCRCDACRAAAAAHQRAHYARRKASR